MAATAEALKPAHHLRAVDRRLHAVLGPEATIEEIGVELAAGNPLAINACYRRLGPLVASYARRRYQGLDPDDVVQATMTELWRVAERFDPSRSLEAWTLHIAARRAIDLIRRQARHSAVSIDSLGDVAGIDGDETAEKLATSSLVRAALQSLPENQRIVLELAYMQDMTQVQIAEHLALPLGTVKARTFRGLKSLRAQVGFDTESADAKKTGDVGGR